VGSYFCRRRFRRRRAEERSEGFMPGLIHEKAPKHIPTLSNALLMLVPQPAQLSDLEKTVSADSVFTQLRFGPLAERSSQPAIHRGAEPPFGPVDKLPGDTPLQDLPKWPLGLPAAPLEGFRNLGCVLDDAMVQQRHARLQAEGHRCSVHLNKNVIRKIGVQVQVT